jgi:glycosyltransferase involved in cell wall biosynthesis
MQKLAVSIPVYKRPALLLRNLQHLAPQCLSNSIDIHIFDDSCSDINQQVYDQISAQWPCLRVHRNTKNLGIDRNIDQCISIPQADYVWMIGEDDLAADGAISEILKCIVSKPEYIFVNYQYISNDYENLLHIAVPDVPAGTLRAGQFFRDNGWAAGFLGANVVNKQRWDNKAKRFMGTYFNHVGKIFSKMDPSDKIEIIADPIIFNRAESFESFTWLKDCFEVNAGFEVMINRLIEDKPTWSEDAKAGLVVFKKKMMIHDLKSILVLRALEIYTLDKYNKYMSKLDYWPIYAVVAVIPSRMLAPAYGIYRYIKFKLIRKI